MSETQGKNTVQEGSKIGGFWKGVRTEFRKIIWPDRYTLGKQLAAVLVVTIVTGVLIALVDFASRHLINFLIGLGA